MNFSMIRYVIGLVMLFESAFLSLPCLIALIYHEKKGFSFWIMLFVCLIIGILFVMKKPKKTVYYAKEGFLTVAISWIVMSFFGALPFVINGDIPSVVDAMFETVSGFTTTGSSILTDVEALARCSLFWRRQYVMTPKFVGSWIYLYTMNWKLTMVTGITAYKLEVII